MKRPRRSNPLAFALFANAMGLLAIALAVWTRLGPSLPRAMAGMPAPQPIAGGGGVYIMPCQLQSNIWGCYLMDGDKQTLAVYEYQAGTRTLSLVASRYYRYDLQLKDFDTKPPWFEIKKMVEEADKKDRPDSNPAPPENP